MPAAAIGNERIGTAMPIATIAETKMLATEARSGVR